MAELPFMASENLMMAAVRNGDGETAIVELCDALEGRRAMESVRNLVYRGPGSGSSARGTRWPTFPRNGSKRSTTRTPSVW